MHAIELDRKTGWHYQIIPYSVYLRPFRHLAVCLLLSIAWILPTQASGQAASSSHAQSRAVHGLPFLRVYPHDEIGYASRSARLMFDPFGRIAVVREGSFAVLNDDIWLNLVEEGSFGMVRIIEGNDKQLYFGSRGTWGRTTFSESGKLTPNILVPKSVPEWTRFAFFDDIVCTHQGVYFGSWFGTVFLKYGTDIPEFFKIKDQNCLVSIADRVFASTKAGEIVELKPTDKKELTLTISANAPVVEVATTLGPSMALVATTSNKLLIFDGNEVHDWSEETKFLSAGKISCIRQMTDGNIAVAAPGSGLFIFSQSGHLLRSFTAPFFRQISDVGSNENGILWLATEDSVLKLLYNCPIEDFGHNLGLVPHWPLLAEYNDTTYIASDQILYTLEGQAGGETAKFKVLAEQPPGGAQTIASDGSSLLIANPEGLYELRGTAFVKISAFAGVNNLVMISSDLFMASSPEEIGAFKLIDGHWKEVCKRIPGVGYSPISHASKFGMLLEMASDGVALAALDPKSSVLTLEKFRPWPDATWISASVLDDIVMFTGLAGQRTFYNLKTKQWNTPELIDSALNQCDQWIIRLGFGKDGSLWGLTNKGVVAFHLDGDRYQIDAVNFDFINAFYPFVRVLASGQVWITGSRSLYRADPLFRSPPAPTTLPSIVSIFETSSNRELYNARASMAGPIKFESMRNSFSIRLFAGTYNARRPPEYVYRMDGGPWTPVNSGSLLSFRGLGDGRYNLEMKCTTGPSATMPPIRLSFAIEPPWYRSVTAKVCYAFACAAVLYIIVRVSNRVARKRSEELEKLVSERTSQLETTMERLNEETRVAATFAERNRLAGEIHDSLQQGLSGAILQLDATMSLPQIQTVVRDRLGVVRNMISFTRHEVQNAVWDKESPLLGDSELGDALHRLTAFINNNSNCIQVTVEGEPRALPTETKHHLMRIAQEATTNAVRHAKASKIAVSLSYKSNELVMQICDDGVGFDQDAVMNIDQGHFGLRGLRSRAKRLNSDLAISSGNGSGTKITVRIKV